MALIRALEVAKRDHVTGATMASAQNNRMFTRYINASGPTAIFHLSIFQGPQQSLVHRLYKLFQVPTAYPVGEGYV